MHSFLSIHGQLTFIRWLPTVLFEEWVYVVEEMYNYKFDNIEDVVSWKW